MYKSFIRGTPNKDSGLKRHPKPRVLLGGVTVRGNTPLKMTRFTVLKISAQIKGFYTDFVRDETVQKNRKNKIMIL